MNYACLIYQDKAALMDTPTEQFVEMRRDCLALIDRLEQSGQHVYSTGLQSTTTSATLRYRDGNISVTDGPFAESEAYLSGLTVLQARDLNEAIQIASHLASVVGGSIEVRPVLSTAEETSDPLDRRILGTLSH